VDSLKINVTENFSYLLGTQAVAQKWVMHKIVMMLESEENWRKICATLDKTFRDIGLHPEYDYKIFYRADRKKIIVIDQTSVGYIPNMIARAFSDGAKDDLTRTRPQKVPQFLRLSATNIYKQFVEGLLDSHGKVSKGGLVKFYVLARDDEVHRFVMMTLALFNIQPRYSFFNVSSFGLPIIHTYLALPKERVFDLRSLSLASQELLTHKMEDEVTLYSTVKSVTRVRRSTYIVRSPKENWNVISDLVPIHSQVVSQKENGTKYSESPGK
jgi:hypothetical protein